MSDGANSDVLRLLESTPIQELATEDFGQPGVLPSTTGGTPATAAGTSQAVPGADPILALLSEIAGSRQRAQVLIPQMEASRVALMNQVQAALDFELQPLSRLERVFGGAAARRNRQSRQARVQAEMLRAVLPTLQTIMQEQRRLMAPTGEEAALEKMLMEELLERGDRRLREADTSLVEDALPGLANNPQWLASKANFLNAAGQLEVPEDLAGRVDMLEMNRAIITAKSMAGPGGGTEEDLRRVLKDKPPAIIDAASTAFKREQSRLAVEEQQARADEARAESAEARAAAKAAREAEEATPWWGPFKTEEDFMDEVLQMVPKVEREFPHHVEYTTVDTTDQFGFPTKQVVKKMVPSVDTETILRRAVELLNVPLDKAAEVYPFLAPQGGGSPRSSERQQRMNDLRKFLGERRDLNQRKDVTSSGGE